MSGAAQYSTAKATPIPAALIEVDLLQICNTANLKQIK